MAAMLTSLFFGARPETVLSEHGTGLQGYLAHQSEQYNPSRDPAVGLLPRVLWWS
jgi:hypothetical protein